MVTGKGDYVAVSRPIQGESYALFLGPGGWTQDLGQATPLDRARAEVVAGETGRVALRALLEGVAVQYVEVKDLDGADIEVYSAQVAEALGRATFSPGEGSLILEWAKAGIEAGLVCGVVREIMARRNAPKRPTLAYFADPVRERVQALGPQP